MIKYEYTSEDLEFRKKPYKIKSKSESNCFLQFIEKIKTNKKIRIITIVSGILLLVLIIILIVVLTRKNDENSSIKKTRPKKPDQNEELDNSPEKKKK